MNDIRSIPEEVMLEKAAQLVGAAKRRSKQLENWGWTDVQRIYRYGPKGTGSARAFIMAERGTHGVALEYLYRLNARYGSPVKFLGGFWDGGPIRSEKSLRELAMPLKSTYTQGSQAIRRNDMATATDTAPRKRAASKRAAATNGKAPARKRAASKTTDDEPVEEKTTKAAEAAEAREARKAARLEKWDDLSNQVFELREEGKGWDEIAEELEMSVGLAQKYLFWHEARQEDGGDIPEATADEVARLRDEEHLSWPRIEVMFDISRQTCWKLYAEAKGDPEAHFSSDIGKGGRYVERDPDEVEARRAARKPASNGTGRRGRPPKFKGFTDETPDEDVMNAVEGKKITWDKTRGGGEDSAVVKEGTMSIVNNKSGRGLQFSDGRKTRTVFVNKIKAVS